MVLLFMLVDTLSCNVVLVVICLLVVVGFRFGSSKDKLEQHMCTF